MKTERIIVGTETVINVQLKEDLASLDEIVVVGYGSQTKKEVTGAVTGVKFEDFNKGSIQNPAQLLQGKVAGLNIVSPQGNPNGAFNIRLRGLSTLGANTQPLIIIDGIIGVDINSIDPNDIASMDVLKDGGAAAIYGTRGSSGVILITTKTGVRGKVKVTYDGSFSTENKDRFLPVMDKKEYLSNGGTDYGGETNWLNEITRTAISQVHNLSLSGGSDQTIYRVSMNYRDVDGVLLNSGFKQLNGRLNLTQKALDNKLTFTLNLAATSKDAQLGFEDAFRSSVVMPPSAPIYSLDPYYSKYGGYFQSEVHEL
jgi:iron complex outermembrane receptor protein